MTENSKEFLQSLHEILPDEWILEKNPDFEKVKIPCCYLLKKKDEKNYTVKLNDTGILIWDLCAEDRSIGEICTLLSEAYEVDIDEIRRDVSRTLEELIENEVVTRKEGT